MLKKLIRVAHDNPETRADLLPIIKEAMEHNSPEALKKYLHEHPKADKSKHTVKKQDGESKKDEKKPAPKKLSPESIDDLDLSSSDAKSLVQDFAKSQNPDISKKQLDNVVNEMLGGSNPDWLKKEDLKEMLKRPKKYIPMDKDTSEPAKKDEKKPPYTKKYNSKVKSVMDKHELTDDDADQVKGFKKSKPDDGKHVSPAELLRRFLAKAKPETKERMKGVSPADFVKMLGAIMDEDEGGGKQAFFREQIARIASEHPETRSHLIPLLKEHYE